MKSYDDYEYISARREGAVLVLSFNHPDDMNALNGDFHSELARIYQDVAFDGDARAIVLTGEGRAFSIGAHWDWVRAVTGETLRISMREARKIIIDLLEVPQPIVAAVNGHAIGLGSTLAFFCDVVYAAQGAKLGDPHVPLGMVAGDGGAIIWPHLVGMAKAKRYLLTGDPVLAEEAAAMGMIEAALPAEEVFDRAMEMAQRLAEMPPLSVQGTKRVLNGLLRATVNQTLDLSLALEQISKETPEHFAALDAYGAQLKARKQAEQTL